MYNLSILHFIIVLYIYIGGIITNNKTLLTVHLLTFITIIFHWIVNNNNCFMTQLTYGENSESHYTIGWFKFFKISIYTVIMSSQIFYNITSMK